MKEEQTDYLATAFLSSSLREEDREFVDYVSKVLEAHKIKPTGTVGKFSASPENPVSLMNKNIPDSDFVVICATPRYVQKDIKTGEESYGLSEMIHVETGMAIAHGKPVVVFVQEGTNIGSALPNVTQYITLNGKEDDFISKKALISSLLNNAFQFVQEMNSNKSVQSFKKFAVGSMAAYGIYKLIGSIFGGESKKETI